MTTTAPLLKMLSFGQSSHEDLINQLNYLTVETRSFERNSQSGSHSLPGKEDDCFDLENRSAQPSGTSFQ